jgi:hypothetical protein
MQFCTAHWNKLRAAIEQRGLTGLVATSGEQAAKQMVDQLEEKKVTKQNFDPLMAAHNMIFSRAMDMVGLALMVDDEDGTPRCPICFVKRAHDEQVPKCEEPGCLWNTQEGVDAYWIAGPADAVREEAVRLGLVASA